MKIATDVGGTFTDYVIFENDKLHAFKALTTHDASEGILKQLGDKDINEFFHGTTAAVNAILERTGASEAFFTTKGFRDLVRIGRQARVEVYSFISKLPKLPVEHIIEVDERISNNGTILKEPSDDELTKLGKKYSGLAEVAVIGFINSYVNPENENKAAEVLKQYFPLVITSHEVRREIREYDRFCTSLMEGYSLPVVQKYMKNLKPLSQKFYIMQSNGGRVNLEYLRAVNMIMSGPAGGIAATQALCKRLGIDNTIAYDMGGTSADVSAIVNNEPLYTDTVHITNIPIKTLAIDIESIGAGGGSIAWIDDGGALKVGPRSAGSNPGPACYNLGGTEFTVSDANLITGVLGDRISKIELHGERSVEVAKKLCYALDKDLMELSNGVIKIVNNNMVSALKRISIGRGYDPREFTLVAFGGAGPMHACAIANAIGISRIIIPPMPGAFSALGIMGAPVRFDYIRTILEPLERAIEIIPTVLEEFQSDLKNKLGNQYSQAITNVTFDLRYSGQGHEINLPGTEKGIDAQRFHTKHQQLFGFSMPDNPIELVNIKMVSQMLAQELPLHKFQEKSPKVQGERDVYPDKNVDVYIRDFFGSTINGPCIIEDETTTIYIATDWRAELDVYNVLKLEREY